MKTKSTRKNSKALQPYESSDRRNKRHVQAPAVPAVPPTDTSIISVQPSSTSRTPKPPANLSESSLPRPLRETFLEQIHINYPGIQPRNDWDIVQLGSTRRPGTPAELYAWLDKTYAEEKESNSEVDECVAELLDAKVSVTGRKPRPDDKLVYTRPIPDSEYSIRLFPGALDAAEYCMDFVETATGHPVNSPFEFELWSVPNPDTPWLTASMTMQLRSIERARRMKLEDILPGEEKFILRDGQTCMLIRPGKCLVRFTVPVRPQPQIGQPEDVVHVLDFPQIAV
ncbi:hypothetical protein OH77DRAFT_1429880 [Trametes cingulata]|nr:hypothetical protein OH77DRAFT_1429880 [Trametes cingulata]